MQIQNREQRTHTTQRMRMLKKKEGKERKEEEEKSEKIIKKNLVEIEDEVEGRGERGVEKPRFSLVLLSVVVVVMGSSSRLISLSIYE